MLNFIWLVTMMPSTLVDDSKMPSTSARCFINSNIRGKVHTITGLSFRMKKKYIVIWLQSGRQIENGVPETLTWLAMFVDDRLNLIWFFSDISEPVMNVWNSCDNRNHLMWAHAGFSQWGSSSQITLTRGRLVSCQTRRVCYTRNSPGPWL